MNTAETLQQFEKIANHYLHELDNFSLEQLKRQPNEDQWSLGQMVQHLINSALYMQLRNIELCMTQTADSIVSSEEMTREGAAVFEQGSFPPLRIHVPPSPQYTPKQPDSIEQLIQGLNTVIQRMKEIEPMLGKASKQHKVSHPRFGALDANEWFQLIEMHYRHHLLQMVRLKQWLEVS